ncbi:DUF1317 family protein [Escherichia coli]|nr:DUF1317 family protein [Escherichia coli]
MQAKFVNPTAVRFHKAPVGAITFVYSITKRGWVFPGLSVIRNPLKAQRLAEKINNKQEDI